MMNPLTGEIGEPRFAPGDKVRIREWDDMEAEYGLEAYGIDKSIRIPCSFIPEMRGLCGRELTVKFSRFDDSVWTNTYVYTFAEDDEDVEQYTIGEEMLELVEPEPEVSGSEEFMTAWDRLL